MRLHIVVDDDDPRTVEVTGALSCLVLACVVLLGTHHGHHDLSKLPRRV